MLGRVGVTAANGGREHHRNLDVAARLEVDLRHVVVDLVETDAHEVGEHELDDRAHPSTAAPMAKPMNAVSEIGVSMTRAAPNFSCRPVVELKIPPYGPTSSPR